MNLFVANPHFEWFKLQVINLCTFCGYSPLLGMAIFLTINSPGILHGQTPASESERDPVVLTVLGPRARTADRIAAYQQRVQIENLLKTFVGPGANRVTREQSRRQLIEEIKKPKGKELLLELIKKRNDPMLEAAAVTAFAEAQPELSDVQLVREVLFSLLFNASTGDIATPAAVGIIRQVQEAYLWRGVDSTVDTAGLGHALIARIQSSTSHSWRHDVLKKLYDEASNRRKHASDPSEIDFFEAILAGLHDYAPPRSSIQEDRIGKELPRKSRVLAIVRGVVIAGIAVLGACGVILLIKGLMMIKPDRASALEERTSDSETRTKRQRLVPVLADLTLEEIEGKRVLVRADLNFLNEWGKLISDASFEHLLPTLRFLQEHKAEKIILLGTAQTNAEGVKEIFDMQRIGDVLQEQLKLPVLTLKHWKGTDAATEVGQTPPGHIVLLGNIGADPREKEDNVRKRQALVDEILAALNIQLYVNDAPQASKYIYASTSELAQKVPRAVAGPLLDAVISGNGTFSEKQQSSAISKLPGAQALLAAAATNSRIGRVSSAMSARIF
ncbi:MAG TPA: phosphoglycerate kinase [Terriglobia bacterium]|nr:phosphoglycerate kinase [Terriglobia bacterium]